MYFYGNPYQSKIFNSEYAKEFGLIPAILINHIGELIDPNSYYFSNYGQDKDDRPREIIIKFNDLEVEFPYIHKKEIKKALAILFRVNVFKPDSGDLKNFSILIFNIKYPEIKKEIIQPKPRKKLTGHIYFIQSKFGKVKIGYSNDYRNRIQAFDFAELLFAKKSSDMVLHEAIYHAFFKDFRDIGEWFRITKEQIEEIIYLKPEELLNDETAKYIQEAKGKKFYSDLQSANQ